MSVAARKPPESLADDPPAHDRVAGEAPTNNLLTALESAEHRGAERLGRRLLGYERLLEISRYIASLDLETALSRILHEVLALTGSRRGALLLLDENGVLEVRAALGLERELATTDGFAFSRSVVEQALTESAAVVIEDVPSSPAAARASIAALGLEAVLAIPLVAHDRVLGAIYADTADGGHDVSVRDRAMLEAFGAQASIALENARLHASLERDYVLLRRSLEGSLAFAGLVYRSTAMERVCRLARHAAKGDARVLLLGETGTGKELVARAIHLESARRRRAFVAQNVGALPDALAEGELFGHRRGAFTGAVESRAGIVEAADGGTLLLDEVGEASPALQIKLLRFLETGMFRRLGDSSERRADVRVIAATHRDLEAEVAAGRFRADLYYRLAVFPIHVPPLRERREDVPVLVRHFLARAGDGGAEPTFEKLPRPVMERLVAHDWPGNVRELRNVVERMAVTAAVEGSAEAAVEAALAGSGVRVPPPAMGGGILAPAVPCDKVEPLETVERRYLRWVLEQVDGNQSRAARLLGLKRSTFRGRLEKLGIDPKELAGRR